MTQSTEKPTQKAIMDYLELKRIFHYRQNSGAMKVKHGFYRFSSMNGLADIVAVINGIYYGIEVKDTKGTQNQNQIVYQKKLEKAGGIYILAKSLDDVIKVI